jgi:hypothetical protein
MGNGAKVGLGGLVQLSRWGSLGGDVARDVVQDCVGSVDFVRNLRLWTHIAKNENP